MTLTDFLLTRIAVDEDRHAFRDLAEAMRGQGMSKVAAFLDEQEARVLAECEAKRRIVEIAGPAVDEDGRHLSGSGIPDILQALAAVYADHSDYDESWRP
jgi:hypothetical protein